MVCAFNPRTQDYGQFKASPSYIVKPCLQTKTEPKRQKVEQEQGVGSGEMALWAKCLLRKR